LISKAVVALASTRTLKILAASSRLLPTDFPPLLFARLSYMEGLFLWT